MWVKFFYTVNPNADALFAVANLVEAGTMKFAGNTVWSVPERFWGGVPQRGAISSVLTFTFTFV